MNNRPSFEVDARQLKSGIILACIGAVIWMLGAVLSATSFGRAAKKWIDQLEESPSEMARRRLNQAKIAAVAGSKAWREEQTP
jgi:hypothetical protein